jgi:hypothetical protein
MSSHAVEFFIGACVGSIAAGLTLGLVTVLLWIVHGATRWWGKRRPVQRQTKTPAWRRKKQARVFRCFSTCCLSWPENRALSRRAQAFAWVMATPTRGLPDPAFALFGTHRTGAAESPPSAAVHR